MESSISRELIIAVAGAFLWELILLFWHRIVVPAFIEKEHTKLARVFQTTLDFPKEPSKLRMRLRKWGHSVQGTFEFIDGKNNAGKQYAFRGAYRNSYLTLVYHGKSEDDGLGQGTGTFKKQGDKQEFQGGFVYVARDGNVKKIDCRFTAVRD